MYVHANLAAAAITFIVLQGIFLAFVFFTREVTKIVYFLCSYTVLRMFSQAIALVIAKNGVAWWLAMVYTIFSTWPIVFLIFSLMCFLFATHESSIHNGDNKLAYFVDEKLQGRILALKTFFMLTALIAITLTITGLAIVAQVPVNEVLSLRQWGYAEGIRTAGSCIFLLLALMVMTITIARFNAYRDTYLAFSFLLTVICGTLVIISLIHQILQVWVPRMNIYAGVGSFVRYQYCMGEAMEFLCSILASYSYCCMGGDNETPPESDEDFDIDDHTL